MRRCIGAVACLFVAAFLLAATPPPLVEDPPPEAPAVASDLDRFAASAKGEVLRAAAAAQQAWERGQQRLISFKARARSALETWRAALSEEKSKVAALTWGTATRVGAWKAIAAQSLVEMRAAAAETLELIATWVRAPSQAPVPLRPPPDAV
jgi:hypothetical protein